MNTIKMDPEIKVICCYENKNKFELNMKSVDGKKYKFCAETEAVIL